MGRTRFQGKQTRCREFSGYTMGQGLSSHPGRVCQEERGLAGRSKGVKAKERIDGRRGSQDTLEAVHQLVESSESGGVGTAAVMFLR